MIIIGLKNHPIWLSDEQRVCLAQGVKVWPGSKKWPLPDGLVKSRRDKGHCVTLHSSFQYCRRVSRRLRLPCAIPRRVDIAIVNAIQISGGNERFQQQLAVAGSTGHDQGLTTA